MIVRTPESWWQITLAGFAGDLELPARVRHALSDARVSRVDQIPDLDLENLALRGIGAKTMEQLMLLRDVLRYRFRAAAPSQEAFEAALPRNRVPPSWQTAHEEDRLESLGLSTRAHRALSACGVSTAGGVLDLTLTEIQAQPGVGAKTRRELEGLFIVLRDRFAPHPRPRGRSIDSYFERILRSCLPGPGRTGREHAVLERLLGLHPGDHQTLGFWPRQTEIAADLGITSSRVQQVVAKARRRWRMPRHREPRNDLSTILESVGGVLTAADLVGSMLELCGSAARPEIRDRRARAVVRAGVEGEAGLATPRFRVYRRNRGLFVGLTDECEGIHSDPGTSRSAQTATEPAPAMASRSSELSGDLDGRT